MSKESVDRYHLKGLLKVVSNGPCDVPAPSDLVSHKFRKWKAWFDVSHLTQTGALKEFFRLLGVEFTLDEPADEDYQIAVELSKVNNMEEAIKAVKKSVDRDCKSEDAKVLLFSLSIRVGDLSGADKIATILHADGISRSPAVIALRKQLDKVMYHTQNCEEARKDSLWEVLFVEAEAAILAGADCCPLFHMAKAESLIHQNRLKEAEGEIVRAPKLLSTHSDFCGIEAETYIENVRSLYDQAAEAAQATQVGLRLEVLIHMLLDDEEEMALDENLVALIKRARESVRQAKTKEYEGGIGAATDILLHLDVDTLGTRAKCLKIAFIREQIRLCLDSNYFEAAITPYEKINPGDFDTETDAPADRETLLVLKGIYDVLMSRYRSHKATQRSHQATMRLKAKEHMKDSGEKESGEL